MSNEVEAAAEFYLEVCEEHGRTFPLRNIVVATAGYLAASDEQMFVEEVRRWLAAYARRRFDEATADRAAERRFGGSSARTSEIEMP